MWYAYCVHVACYLGAWKRQLCYVAFVSILVFQTFDRMIYCTGPTNGTRSESLGTTGLDHMIHLKSVYTDFVEQVTNLNIVACSAKGWHWHSDVTVQDTFCAANRLRCTFAEYLTVVKKLVLCLLHVTVCLPIGEHVHTQDIFYLHGQK